MHSSQLLGSPLLDWSWPGRKANLIKILANLKTLQTISWKSNLKECSSPVHSSPLYYAVKFKLVGHKPIFLTSPLAYFFLFSFLVKIIIRLWSLKTFSWKIEHDLIDKSFGHVQCKKNNKKRRKGEIHRHTDWWWISIVRFLITGMSACLPVERRWPTDTLNPQ